MHHKLNHSNSHALDKSESLHYIGDIRQISVKRKPMNLDVKFHAEEICGSLQRVQVDTHLDDKLTAPSTNLGTNIIDCESPLFSKPSAKKISDCLANESILKSHQIDALLSPSYPTILNLQNKDEEKKEHIGLEIVRENRTAENNSNTQSPSNRALQAQTQDVVPTEIRNPEQSVAQQSNLNTRPLSRQEVEVHLTKSIGNFVALIAVSVFLLMVIKFDISFHGLFLIAFSYLIFNVVIDMFWTRRVLGACWKKSDAFINCVDFVICFASLLLVYIKFLELTSFSFFACIPFMTLAITSSFFSEDQIQRKFWVNFIRIIYSCEILMITSKIDSHLVLEWSYMFILPWSYLAVKTFFGILKATLLVFNNRNQPAEVASHIKIIGFLWSIMDSLTYAVMILALFGVAAAYNEEPAKDFELLSFAAYIGAGIGTVLLFYTLFARNVLIKFILSFKMIESLFSGPDEREKKGDKVTFSVEKKEDYFVMVSSTYFVPLQQGFNTKDPENLEKMKNMFKSLKFDSTNTQELGREGQKIANVDYETLKKFKEDLDKKLHNIKDLKSSVENVRAPRICDTVVVDIKGQGLQLQDQEPMESDRKLSVSFDNNKLRDNTTSPQVKEQIPFCCICCINQSDTIFMDCGHGGVCHGCATTLIEKKNECIQCRAKAEGLYKINLTPVFSNIFKGVEFTKIIIK